MPSVGGVNALTTHIMGLRDHGEAFTRSVLTITTSGSLTTQHKQEDPVFLMRSIKNGHSRRLFLLLRA